MWMNKQEQEMLSVLLFDKDIWLILYWTHANCYVLRKGHRINKTNMCLERRINVIYYSKQAIQCC